MGKSTDNGGAAFPVSSFAPGMSLRDYFAGQALIPFVNCSLKAPAPEGDTGLTAARRYAKVAYGIADAMLKAREEQS